jgi:hypothetical protein
MNINELLPLGGIEALANQLGVSPQHATRGAEALLPSVIGGMGDEVGQMDSHVKALGGAELATNVISSEPTDLSRGNQLLGGIFGSKDVSRRIVGMAADNSGLDPSFLKRMLPILAMLVAGHLAGRSDGQQGGFDTALRSVLGDLAAGDVRGALGGAATGGILGSIIGKRP